MHYHAGAWEREKTCHCEELATWQSPEVNRVLYRHAGEQGELRNKRGQPELGQHPSVP